MNGQQQTGENPATEATDITAFGTDGWHWLNPPRAWSAGSDLQMTTDPDTDFWRVTHYGFTRDTAHALLRPIEADQRLTVTFRGDYREQYDQAGLLLRIDESNWIKTGIEYVDGEHLLSVVVTRGFSDWSVLSLPQPATDVTVELLREGDTVAIRYGLDGAEPEQMLRLAYFPPGLPAVAGPMCASPKGAGFDVAFTRLDIAPAGIARLGG